MMPGRDRIGGVLSLLAVAVVVELVVLRTITRSLVHIPGTDRYETPIRLLADTGRLAYYLAAVAVIALLTVLAARGLRGRATRVRLGGAAIALFLVTGAAGRIEAVASDAVGWVTLAVLPTAVAAAWRGVRSLPVGLFVLGCVAAGLSVLAQQTGQVVAGRMDLLVWGAELSLVAAGLTSPLLLSRPPGRSACMAGVISVLVAIAAFGSSASTVTVLLLWNVGVPGWLPGVAYALAFGTMVTTLSAAVRTERDVAVGVVMLAAGGVGLVSTYQTGLVLAGVLVLGGFGTLAARSPTLEVPSVDAPAGTDRALAAVTTRGAPDHESVPGVATHSGR